MGLDGFMFDAPPYYLALGLDDGENPLSGLHDNVISGYIRRVLVEPLHRVGAAAFGETYNLLRPSYNKMLDGGRNTDMADGVPGFPSKLHDIVVGGDASKLERLLKETLDVMSGWSGGSVRIEADDRGNATIASQKAAVTILVGAYYVVRMGDPNCTSPLPSYPPYSHGDEWPGGCFGRWTGATDSVRRTLQAAHAHESLRPGTKRTVLVQFTENNDRGVYAMLRGDDAVVVFNFSPRRVVARIDPAISGVDTSQRTDDWISGDPGPSVPESGAWSIEVEAHGWRVLGLSKKVRDAST